MRALVHTAPYQFELRHLPDPEPGTGEVLIRVRAVGICGSDVHGMTGSTGRRIPPIVMGHEAAGDVVEVGPESNPAWIGKRVTFDSTIYCGTCEYCREGHINLCDNRKVLGVSCEEYRLDGAFAGYVVVPQHVVYELPESIGYEHGAMTEPLSVALHAVRLVNPGPNDRVLVVGCGIIGLLVIQAARAAGCRSIIATDLSDGRLQVARDCGASEAVKPDRLADVEDVHIAFDAVGSAGTVAPAIGKVRKGGAAVLIGNLAPEIAFPLQRVVARQITVAGSCASSGEYAECLELLSTGKVDVGPLITERVPLVDAAPMFVELHEHPERHLKAMVIPEEEDV